MAKENCLSYHFPIPGNKEDLIGQMLEVSLVSIRGQSKKGPFFCIICYRPQIPLLFSLGLFSPSASEDGKLIHYSHYPNH